MPRPHPCAHSPKLLPHFTFLNHAPKHLCQHLSWEAPKPIVTVDDQGSDQSLTLTNLIPSQTISQLLNLASPSLVGKNEETVYDEELRRSHEITHEHLTLDKDFQAVIEPIVSQMATELKHPTIVKAQLYKLVIYGPGDFFTEHMDAPHHENMIATLSVEIATDSDPEGGDLIINNEIIAKATESELRLAMFYHDTPHKVEPLQSGYRLSLLFDIIQEPTVNGRLVAADVTSFIKGIGAIKGQGFNKIAIKTCHRYISSETIDYKDLKGVDRLFYELARSCSDHTGFQLVEVCDEGWIYRKELTQVLALSQAFGALYRVNEEEDNNPCHCGCESCWNLYDEEKALPPHPVKYSSISPHLDKASKYLPISPDYLLGDILFLKTPALSHLEYSGSDEVNLGNEGFYGQIHSNYAIIAMF